MQCPFPGMDPYIERPAIWADFHDRLIPAISAALQPMLRPRYVALVQDRLYVVQAQRPIRPDVFVVESGHAAGDRTATAVIAELAEPVVFELAEEEIREPYVEILEPAVGNRLVTAIEVLSHDNKLPGPGRRSICASAGKFWLPARTWSRLTCCAPASRLSASPPSSSRRCRRGITWQRYGAGPGGKRFTQSRFSSDCRKSRFRCNSATATCRSTCTRFSHAAGRKGRIRSCCATMPLCRAR
jgi:hypothetical protein